MMRAKRRFIIYIFVVIIITSYNYYEYYHVAKINATTTLTRHENPEIRELHRVQLDKIAVVDIQGLTKQLSLVRRHLLDHHMNKSEPCPQNRVAHVLLEHPEKSKYLRDVLRWSAEAEVVALANVPVQEERYYKATSVNCELMEPGTHGPITSTCTTDINVGMSHKLTTDDITTYLVFLPNSVVNSDGQVISSSLKLIPKSCLKKGNTDCIETTKKTPIYDEVFTISMYWGIGYFHSTIEDIPRLMPYIEFLHQHPTIKVHVAGNHPFLPLLNITQSRLVNGTVRAGLLYMPEGTRCGYAGYFTINSLAQHFQKLYLFPPKFPQDTIVVIRRSQRRWFRHHDAIVQMVQRHANKTNLKVFEFIDNPVPSIKVTMEMFDRAVIIIAPHGAGESNIIFSRLGTVLIEGLCYDEEHRVNKCYRTLANRLGLRYHSLVYEKQCMEITAADVEQSLTRYLKLLHYY